MTQKKITSSQVELSLDNLTDVDAISPTGGDVLTYESMAGRWVPAAPAAGGGGGSPTSQIIQLEGVFSFGGSQTTWTDHGTGGTMPLSMPTYLTLDPYGAALLPIVQGLYEIQVIASMYVTNPTPDWPLGVDTTYGSSITFNDSYNYVVGAASSHPSTVGVLAHQRRHFRPTATTTIGMGIFSSAVSWSDHYLVNIGSTDFGSGTTTMTLSLDTSGYETGGITGVSQVVLRVTKLADIRLLG